METQITEGIMAQSDVLEKVMGDFEDIARSQAEAERALSQKNKALFDNWLGVAGDNFRLASNNIEKRLGNIIIRHDNAAKALQETAVRFSDAETTMVNAAGEM